MVAFGFQGYGLAGGDRFEGLSRGMMKDVVTCRVHHNMFYVIAITNFIN